MTREKILGSHVKRLMSGVSDHGRKHLTEVETDLKLLTQGMIDGAGNPIGRQSDRVEWRVFVRYEPGSYDPVQGLAHGWKMTPRLTTFAAQYFGPGMTLRRLSR